MKHIITLLLAVLAVSFSGCSTPSVSYEDPGSLRPLTTGFTLSDLNQVADTMVSSMLSSPSTRNITRSDERPILIVERVRNNSDQHIDTESITDTIRTELIKSGVFRFTDKVSRDWQRDEIDYQNRSGMVAPEAAVQRGRQLGAQYMVTGRIVSYEERDEKTLRKSYKFTMNLIDLDSGIIEWADEKPITKVRRKR